MEKQTIHSKSTSYLIRKVLGQGSFGRVAECLNLNTRTLVAVKIMKKSRPDYMKEEVEMLRKVNMLDPDKTNIITFIESFTYLDRSYMVFEMLDKSLEALLTEKPGRRLSLNEIRPIAQQLLTALTVLRDLNIIHTDLTGENVMLVNHQEEPYRVKLIDFGLARHVRDVKKGKTLTPMSYRAPEVNLGLPITTAVDIFSLGCLLGEMFLGDLIFPGYCDYTRIRDIVAQLGQPDNNLIIDRLYKYGFVSSSDLKYQKISKKRVISERFFSKVRSLECKVLRQDTFQDPVTIQDKVEFLNLLKRLLNMNAKRRITPRDALKHTFLTMKHLKDNRVSTKYAEEAAKYMRVTVRLDSDESHYPHVHTHVCHRVRRFIGRVWR